MRQTKDIKIGQVTLYDILNDHKKWVHEEGGKRANLRGADLRGANLSGADLRGADLSDADLSGADLRGADLSDADLRGADLRGADLSDADLSGADLRGAYLRGADLRGADLSGADLSGANLSDANLSDKQIEKYLPLMCPEYGSFIAWKKLNNKMIAKLEIHKDAKRSSAYGRKCRASKAKVIAIYSGEKEVQEGTSQRDSNFIYKVGECVEPTTPYEENRFKECASGIHFFITKAEAENY